MVVSMSKAFSDGTNNYCFNIYPELEWNFYKGWGLHVCKYYDEIICFGHLNSFIFGHWFFDELTPMMLLPEDVFYRAKVYVTFNNDVLVETLEILGKSRDDVVVLPFYWNCLIYARRLYALVPPSHISIFGMPLRKLSYRFKKAMHVENNIATRYMLMNRKGGTRVITKETFTQLLDYLNTEYKQYNWEVLMDNPRFNESIILWSQIKFIIAPTGSNLMPEIFMPKGSVVISIQANIIDTAFHKAAITFDLLTVSFSCSGANHFKGKDLVLSLPDAKRIIKIAMYAHDHGKYPPKSADYNY